MATKRSDLASKRRKIIPTEDQKLAQDLEEFWQTSSASASNAPPRIQWRKDDQSLFDDVDHIIESPLYDIAKDKDFKSAYESILQTRIAAITARTKRQKAEAEKTQAIALQDNRRAQIDKGDNQLRGENQAYVNALRRTTETNQLYQNRLELYEKGFNILHDEHELLLEARTSDLNRIHQIEAEYQQGEKRFQEAAEQSRQQQEMDRNQTIIMADASMTMEAEQQEDESMTETELQVDTRIAEAAAQDTTPMELDQEEDSRTSTTLERASNAASRQDNFTGSVVVTVGSCPVIIALYVDGHLTDPNGAQALQQSLDTLSRTNDRAKR